MKLISPDDKILLLSPHPDDFEFGCGGTIHHHRNKVKTRLVVLSNRERTRGELRNKEQQERSAEKLGCSDIHFYDLYIRMFGSAENRDKIRSIITEHVRSFKPDIVFFPSPREAMQDHQALAEEVIRIIRTSSLLAYEVPKHTRIFNPNIFVQITESDLRAKIEALQLFSEQAHKYYFDSEALRAMAVFRATIAGLKGLAEGFELFHHCEPARA